MEIPTMASYVQRLLSIYGVATVEELQEFHWPFETVEEARYQLTRLKSQKTQIEQLKRDIRLTISDIHSHFATQKVEVGKGVGSAILGGLFGRKAVGQGNAVARDQLRRQEHDLTRSYQDLIGAIDQFLPTIDNTKAIIEKALADIQADRSAAVTVGSSPIEERLSALEGLRNKGLVSDAEYAQKCQKLLDEM